VSKEHRRGVQEKEKCREYPKGDIIVLPVDVLQKIVDDPFFQQDRKYNDQTRRYRSMK
jgi:hypothetical protein